MTLETAQITQTPTSVFSDGFTNWAVLCIGMDIPYGLAGVQKDVERWLFWLLDGGSRPHANKRSTDAEGVNVLIVVQDFLCRSLDANIDQINFHDPVHYALVERATRPLPRYTERVKQPETAENEANGS
jgi:hypothetical protein